MKKLKIRSATPEDHLDIQDYAYDPANDNIRSLSFEETGKIIKNGAYFLITTLDKTNKESIVAQCYCLDVYDDKGNLIGFELGGILIKSQVYRGCSLAYYICLSAIARSITLNGCKDLSFIAHVLDGNKNPNSLLRRLGFEYESTSSYDISSIDGIAHMCSDEKSHVDAHLLRLSMSSFDEILTQATLIPRIVKNKNNQQFEIEIDIPAYGRKGVNDANSNA